MRFRQPKVRRTRKFHRTRRLLRFCLSLHLVLLIFLFKYYFLFEVLVSYIERRRDDGIGYNIVQPAELDSSVLRYEESLQTSADVFILGMVKSAEEVTNRVLYVLVEYNCYGGYDVRILLPGGEIAALQERYRSYRKNLGSEVACGSFLLLHEPYTHLLGSMIHKMTHKLTRIRDISFLRDSMRQRFVSDAQAFLSLESSVVVVVDLDLKALPPFEVMKREIQRFRRSDDHVACSFGHMYAPYGYYDIFATVFLPNTFVYPLEQREVTEIYPDEDRSLIRSDSEFGYFQQGDIYNMIAERSFNGSFPARSCFGGLALYKSRVYTDSTCSYSSRFEDLKRYGVKNVGTCEHITFHECLRRSFPELKLVIRTSLKTEWQTIMESESDRISSSGVNFIVTRALQKDFTKYEKNHRLVSEDLSLQVTLECKIALSSPLGFHEISMHKYLDKEAKIKGENCYQILATTMIISKKGILSCRMHCMDIDGESFERKIWETKKIKGSKVEAFSAVLYPNGRLTIIEEGSAIPVSNIL